MERPNFSSTSCLRRTVARSAATGHNQFLRKQRDESVTAALRSACAALAGPDRTGAAWGNPADAMPCRPASSQISSKERVQLPKKFS